MFYGVLDQAFCGFPYKYLYKKITNAKKSKIRWLKGSKLILLSWLPSSISIFFFYFRSLVGKCAEPGGETAVICAACARNAWRDQMFRNTFLKGVEYNSVRFYEPLCRANIKNQNVPPPPQRPLKKNLLCFIWLSVMSAQFLVFFLYYFSP